MGSKQNKLESLICSQSSFMPSFATLPDAIRIVDTSRVGTAAPSMHLNIPVGFVFPCGS